VTPEGMTCGEANLVFVRRRYAGFRRSMEAVIGAPWTSIESPTWRTLYGPIYGAWRAPRLAPCRRKTWETAARSSKMNVDGATCRVVGTRRSFAMLTLSREAKSVTSVYSAWEGAKKSPCNRSEEPYNIFADEAFKSSFDALRTPNRPMLAIRSNVHRHGKSGRSSADGVDSVSCH
jgi:hypothetical protein